MSRIIWDATGNRFYETGVKQAVLYPQANGLYPLGVAWNGITGVTESPSGAEASPLYADDIKYLNLISAEEFGATIEAYTFPDEFAICDGSAAIATGVSIGQQTRTAFGLAYKTTLGNDTDGVSHGYKLHLIYGAMAAPSEKAYATINESPEAITFSWALTTIPVAVTGKNPTASLVIDSTKVDAGVLAALEDIIYGTPGLDPRLPLPDEIATLFASAAPSAVALSSIVPADGASGILATANIVITFNNKIAREAIVLTKADGTIAAFAKSWDTDGKVLTIDPTVNMSSGITYIVTIGGVVDIYGSELAASVKDFTIV
jgi:hypothetical protein